MKRPNLSSGNTFGTNRWNGTRNSGCHGFSVFDEAVSLRSDNASKEYGLTEDSKTVAPVLTAFRFKVTSFPTMQTVYLQSVTRNRIHTGRLRWRGYGRGA